MHAVIETRAFEKDAADVGLDESEKQKIVAMVSENPEIGVFIPGTGGARKFRVPFGKKGKRSGARVVTYFSGDDIPVFLLSVFKKGDRIDLSQKEREAFKRTLKTMARDYRDRMERSVTDLKNAG